MLHVSQFARNAVMRKLFCNCVHIVRMKPFNNIMDDVSHFVHGKNDVI